MLKFGSSIAVWAAGAMGKFWLSIAVWAAAAVGKFGLSIAVWAVGGMASFGFRLPAWPAQVLPRASQSCAIAKNPIRYYPKNNIGLVFRYGSAR